MTGQAARIFSWQLPREGSCDRRVLLKRPDERRQPAARRGHRILHEQDGVVASSRAQRLVARVAVVERAGRDVEDARLVRLEALDGAVG